MRLIPHDENDFAYIVTFMRVERGGSLRLLLGDHTIRTVMVTSGAYLNLPIRRIFQTGTTASGFNNDVFPDSDNGTRNIAIPYATVNSPVPEPEPEPEPEPAPSYPAPWAYYPLSANADDASGNGRHLIGEPGSYDTFDGVVNGYTDGDISLTCAESSSPSGWTMCGWLRGAPSNFVDPVYGTLYWDGADATIYSFTIQTLTVPGLSQSVAQEWNHVAVTRQSSNPLGYINGEYVGQGSGAANGYAFEIYNTSVDGTSNSICEAALWDSVLNALEIAAVHSQGDDGNPLVS